MVESVKYIEDLRQGTILGDDKIEAVAMAVDIRMWPKLPRLECASALQHIQKTCLLHYYILAYASYYIGVA